jgi:hypothetical protein
MCEGTHLRVPAGCRDAGVAVRQLCSACQEVAAAAAAAAAV